MSRRYRNRRIGEFLKELDLTEGRTSFVIRLPVHERARVTSLVATPEVTTEVATLLAAVNGEMPRQALQTNRLQRYRLTDQGRQWLQQRQADDDQATAQ